MYSWLYTSLQAHLAGEDRALFRATPEHRYRQIPNRHPSGYAHLQFRPNTVIAHCRPLCSPFQIRSSPATEWKLPDHFNNSWFFGRLGFLGLRPHQENIDLCWHLPIGFFNTPTLRATSLFDESLCVALSCMLHPSRPTLISISTRVFPFPFKSANQTVGAYNDDAE
jgi:hypothetical protein